MPTVLVTGANRGLGLEFTRQYAADGWRVIACCRTPDKAAALRTLAEGGELIQIEKLDITNDESIASLKSKLKGRPLDILINNAGIFSGTGIDGHVFLEGESDDSQHFGSIDPAAWAKSFRANAIAPVMVTQALTQNLALGKERKAVMISSKMGSITSISREGDTAYRTSKAALNAAVKSISFTLKDEKIIVVSFHPGWVKTDMGSQSAELTPKESIASMRKVISTFAPKDSGRFFNYDGQPLPW